MDMQLLHRYKPSFAYYVPKNYSLGDIEDLYAIEDHKTIRLRDKICLDLITRFYEEWFDMKLCWNDSCYSNSKFRCSKCYHLLCSKVCLKIHSHDCTSRVKKKDC